MKPIRLLWERWIPAPVLLACIHCGRPLSVKSRYGLCRICRQRVEFGPLVCGACGRRRPLPALPCPCQEESLPFDEVYIAVAYGAVIRALVGKFKYFGQSYLARPLGEMLAALAQQKGLQLDLLVPLPACRRRQRQRGYDQAHLLAQAAAACLGIPTLDLLERTRWTAPLAGLSPKERSAEVEGAFALQPEAAAALQARLEGLARKGHRAPYRIALIDDIYTTGATAQAAAQALRAAFPEAVLIVLALSGNRS